MRPPLPQTIASRTENAGDSTHASIESGMPRALSQTLRLYLWFPLGYVIFGGVGLLTSALALVASRILPVRTGRILGQELIHRLFAFFVWYLRTTGLACFRLGDLDKLKDWRGGIIVANHPCLMDVVWIVSRLPRVFCMMKSNVIHNLTLCGTAILAGYVDNRSGKGMVQECINRIQQGETMLIFPEGTRSRNAGVNPFKMGFALVAGNVPAPIQSVVIRSTSRYLAKEWPFLKAPESFPVHYSVRLGPQFSAREGCDAKVLGQQIQEYYQSILQTENVDRSASPCEVNPI
jgi:1-acyl-sn-glycerol-3-phosphate acyltransferase